MRRIKIKQILMFPSWIVLNFVYFLLDVNHTLKVERPNLSRWTNYGTNLNMLISIMLWIWGLTVVVF